MLRRQRCGAAIFPEMPAEWASYPTHEAGSASRRDRCRKGDLRHPYIVGCLWNGEDPSPEKNSNGKNDLRLIHTRKGHRLLFDDGDKGLVKLELNDGKKLAIDDDGIVLDDGNGNQLKIQSNSGAVSIEAKGKLSLKGTSISIEATGTLDLKAGGNASLSGATVRIN